jgi:hypothetical protein
MRELNGVDPQHLPEEVLCSREPLVLRGLVAQWPAVRAAAEPGQLLTYLRGHDVGAVLDGWIGPPEIEGHFHYTEDLRGFNFAREKMRFGALLDALERHRDDPRPPALYVGASTVDTVLPRFRAENDLHSPFWQPAPPLASLWLGNRTRVAAHQDLPDNIACVVAGRRRFTLLPPEQVRHLYVGPLEHTPAGQPISLVDFARPDLARFPKFAEAQAHLQAAELGPGDAIFIPSLWWHQVESLAPVNLLVNYWWRRTPMHMDSPMGALLQAMMTVRDLPPEQRAAWRTLFDHYVFDADALTAAHLPEHARDVLATPMPETTARALRARLIRRLNR